MPRKIEKNAKSKEEALRLAAEEFGVSIEELSYTVEREIGKGILGRLLGREVIISAWITKEAQEEEQLSRMYTAYGLRLRSRMMGKRDGRQLRRMRHDIINLIQTIAVAREREERQDER